MKRYPKNSLYSTKSWSYASYRSPLYFVWLRLRKLPKEPSPYSPYQEMFFQTSLFFQKTHPFRSLNWKYSTRGVLNKLLKDYMKRAGNLQRKRKVISNARGTYGGKGTHPKERFFRKNWRTTKPTDGKSQKKISRHFHQMLQKGRGSSYAGSY